MAKYMWRFLLLMMMTVLPASPALAGISWPIYQSNETKSNKASSKHWCFPLPGAKVTSPYGKRGKRNHSGVDIKTKDRDSIYAAFDGEVVFSKPYHGYGNLVRIKHANGLETYYSHNSENLVKEGQHVKAGQVIALVGQTGRATTPHLHFEIRVNGKTRNPADYFDFKKHVYRKR